jgi:signal transduction histidine kinase/AmiR/NasT family two-component response regulator
VVAVSDGRIALLLGVLERIAGGEHTLRAPISPGHDEIDALAHAVNVLVGELDFALSGQRSAKELAVKANGAKTALLRNVSHEMRTPLAAILGMNELLLSPGLSDERRLEISQRIHAHGRRLTLLIDRMLDLSSLEAGTLELSISRFRAREAIADVLEELALEAQQRGIRLVAEVAPDLDDGVLADPKRVRQILTVLIVAALRHSTHDEIRVRLLRSSRAAVVIDVVDRGPRHFSGEEEELFEPFSGSDTLGLALSRRLARAMSGDLTLSDDSLRLLLASVPSSERGPTAAEVPADLQGRRILLAEDDDDIREATACVLQLQGAEVREACDGVEAIELASSERFDVLVMDMRMPRLDGLTATRQLRARGVTIPIVALTADAVAEHRQECLNAGCNAHLVKPVDIDQLIEVLKQIADQSSSAGAVDTIEDPLDKMSDNK